MVEVGSDASLGNIGGKGNPKKKKKKKAILALNWILRQNSCLSYKKKKRFHTSKLYLVVFSSFFLYF